MSPYVKDSPTTIAQKAPPTSESASAAAMALDGPVRPLSHGVPWRDAKEPVVPYGESSVHVSCALPEVELGSLGSAGSKRQDPQNWNASEEKLYIII